MNSWNDYSPLGRALIYVRDCLKFTKETKPAHVHSIMLNMIQKRSHNWSRADLTALAAGAILLLAEKLCPGESSTPTSSESLTNLNTKTPLLGSPSPSTSDSPSPPEQKP